MFKQIIILSLLFFTYACAGNPSAARKDPKTITQTKTNTIVRLGDNFLNKGDKEAAYKFYLNAHKKEPKAHAPIIKIFDLLMSEGKTKEATKFMKRIVKKHPEVKSFTMSYARLLVNSDLKNANDFLGQATQQFADPLLYNWYGISQDLNGNHDKAQISYRKGLTLEKENQAIMNNLALSYGVSNQRDNAIKLFESLTKKANRKTLYRRNKAIIHILNDELSLAQKELAPYYKQYEIQQLIITYQEARSLSSVELIKMIHAG